MVDTSSGGGARDSESALDAVAVERWRASGTGSLPGLDELARMVDRLLALDVDTVTDDDLADAMVGLRRQRSRLDAAVSRLTARFDARGVWGEDGSRSAVDWIASRARLPRPQVAGEVRDARRLVSMPHTRHAWRSGEVSSAHVRTLCRLAGHPRAGHHFPDGEELLVHQASQQRFEDWARLCAYWCDAADPDGPEHRRDRDNALRSFRIAVGLDGIGHPDGYLTPVAAATVTGALEAIERELFTADWATAKEIHGDEATLTHLARTPAQRRHDALVEMAQRAATTPADGQRPAPLVTVMVDYPTLAGRVCELAGGGTIVAPGDIVELLARDETLIERVVFDGANRVRDLSSSRTFRGTLRRILDLSQRRCSHPTCYVPGHLCQGDHILPVSHGGTTTATNGRLACGYHNRWWYQNDQAAQPPDGRPRRQPTATPDQPPAGENGTERPP
jgi:hypothetical protein